MDRTREEILVAWEVIKARVSAALEESRRRFREVERAAAKAAYKILRDREQAVADELLERLIEEVPGSYRGVDWAKGGSELDGYHLSSPPYMELPPVQWGPPLPDSGPAPDEK